MIHILQFLCPQRHCYTAVAWDDQTTDLSSAHVLVGTATAELHKAGVPMACALCGSTDFRPEDGITRFTTMDEARPHIEACELSQQLTRKYLAWTIGQN